MSIAELTMTEYVASVVGSAIGNIATICSRYICWFPEDLISVIFDNTISGFENCVSVCTSETKRLGI